MRKFAFVIATSLAMLAGCVTINVYFPAAAAQKAADEIIRNVIGPAGQSAPATQQPAQPAGASSSGGHEPLALRALDALVPAVQAAESEPDLNIQTPDIQAIQARMRARFEGSLKALLDAGAIGFARNGDVTLRDASKVPLSQRAQVNGVVSDENADRAALYNAIAAANAHPEWAGRIREAFAKRWIANAKAGWYVQDASGKWQQK